VFSHSTLEIHHFAFNFCRRRAIENPNPSSNSARFLASDNVEFIYIWTGVVARWVLRRFLQVDSRLLRCPSLTTSRAPNNMTTTIPPQRRFR
jgi:hypothetical protein